jgi:5'-nucleotidase/UDP-sugar diphosphatase
MDILFIGIIAEAVLSMLSSDEIGTYISLEDAAEEIGKICNAYRNSDIDLTVLLTHIGFEEDKRLAALLQPEWGVDLIIGGHSHTILDQPAVVNDVLIAQAGVGTDQIGRFDLVVDSETNSITEWQWQLIPVDDQLAEPDQELQSFIDTYKRAVDQKYSRVLCRLAAPVDHTPRCDETTLGNLVADILAQRSGADVVLLGGGSIRLEGNLGPVITLGDLQKFFPYDGPVVLLNVTGAQLLHIFSYFMAPEHHHEDGVIYQVNRGVQAVYANSERQLQSLTVNQQPVKPEGTYNLCVLEHHFKNSDYSLDTTNADLTALATPRVVSTSARDVIEAYLSSHQHIRSETEGRMKYV